MDLARVLARRVERLEQCCDDHTTKIRELEGILRRTRSQDQSPKSGAIFPSIRSVDTAVVTPSRPQAEAVITPSIPVDTQPKSILAKPVPEHIPMTSRMGLDDDPRIQFFISQSELYQVSGHSPASHYLNLDETNTKYYYRKIGGKLEPLGKFKKLIWPHNQFQAASWNGINVYTIIFDKAQIKSEDGDELYYTDKPPTEGRGGRKTRRNKKRNSFKK